jgi:hypothetical protein
MTKRTLLTPDGKYFGFINERGHLYTAGGKRWAHFSGNSIISPTGTVLGHINRSGRSLLSPTGKLLYLISEEK